MGRCLGRGSMSEVLVVAVGGAGGSSKGRPSATPAAPSAPANPSAVRFPNSVPLPGAEQATPEDDYPSPGRRPVPRRLGARGGEGKFAMLEPPLGMPSVSPGASPGLADLLVASCSPPLSSRYLYSRKEKDRCTLPLSQQSVMITA